MLLATLLFLRKEPDTFPIHFIHGKNWMYSVHDVGDVFLVYPRSFTLRVCAFNSELNKQKSNVYKCENKIYISFESVRSVAFHYKKCLVRFLPKIRKTFYPQRSNPFNTGNVNEYIFDELIIHKSNNTYDSGLSTCVVHTAFTTRPRSILSYHMSLSSKVTFFTCYSKPSLSFALYINPFDAF